MEREGTQNGLGGPQDGDPVPVWWNKGRKKDRALLRAYFVPHPKRHEPMTIRCGRLVVTAKGGAAYALARKLLDLGVHPETFLQVYAVSGAASLQGEIGEFAKWAVTDSDSRGLRRQPYAPDPRFAQNAA